LLVICPSPLSLTLEGFTITNEVFGWSITIIVQMKNAFRFLNSATESSAT
jgi:hypothetical protein